MAWYQKLTFATPHPTYLDTKGDKHYFANVYQNFKNMQAFGCKNFRKFQNLPMIDLGGINIFVGTNNSGKSTAIKGMILLLDNILSWERTPDFGTPFTNYFRFMTESSSHLYLGGYEKSLNSESKGEPMSFSFTTGCARVELGIDNRKPAESSGLQLQKELNYFEVENLETNILFHFDFNSKEDGLLTIILPVNLLKADLEYQISNVVKRINGKSSKEAPKDESSWADVASAMLGPVGIFGRAIYKSLTDDPVKDYEALTAELERISQITDDKLKITAGFRFRKGGFSSFKKSQIVEEIEKYGEFSLQLIRDSFKRIAKDTMSINEFHYVEAHNATHKNFVNIEDKDDFLSQTLSKFLREGVDKDKKSNRFVEKWLNEFNIASTYSFQTLYEDIVVVNLLDNKNNSKNLGSYGTGSIQLFILLLQIATAIHSGKSIIMFIEEPEQNLHPALQSKLADLFYEVWKESNGRIRFVVETHSEYLVRRFQVRVAMIISQAGDNIENVNHDVKVYYFQEGKTPYKQLSFKNNGRFNDKFGEGFYDEAVRSNHQLTLIERED